MDLNALKYFITVFEQQSVSAAAQKLGVSPSAVSQNISKLNEFYDERLFTRKSNALIPTAKGYSLYAAIKPHYDEILTQTTNLRSATKTKRVISYFSHRDGDLLFLPQLTSLIGASNYDLTLVNIATNADEETWHDELIQRQSDFIISTQPVTHTGFENDILLEMELVAVCRADHPNAERLSSKDSFFDFDYIAWSTPKDQRLVLDTIHQGQLKPRKVVYHSDSLLSSMFLVSRSDWVCVIPSLYAHELKEEMNLAIYPLPFEKKAVMPLYLSYRKGSEKDEVMSWLLKQVRESFDLASANV